MKQDLYTRRYPIGDFQFPEVVTINNVVLYIKEIESLPGKISDLCLGLPDEQYGNKYRKGSWNVRQLLFHITDSHSHSYIRFKWTLTEDRPIIKAYNESDWAVLSDGLHTPICEIVEELKIIQRRLGRVIRSLTEDELNRSFIHPETNKEITLGQLIAMYAWHGNHHLAHLKLAIQDPVDDYVPIDCNFYDELVLHAMKKTPLSIVKPESKTTVHFIKDIYTQEKEEYLLLDDESTIRLDNIASLKGESLILR
ncbi:MAG: putative metal-dependent hydrolase [Saprospiraceae bacterium]|nr:putative metal-dependent hydrolase [Saprospiraceae bacterium]